MKSFALVCAVLAVSAWGSHGCDDSLDQYTLIWEDNFDFLDLNKWDHEVTAWGGGNQEFQVYTTDTDNSYAKDGKLFIKPTPIRENTDPRTGQKFGDRYMYDGTLDLAAMYGRCTNTNNNGCYRNGGQIPPVMSARLRSAGRFSFKYGRVEVLAKMPAGDWMWPAIWLLPENWEYGAWPMSGEIDIMESIGNEDLRDRQSNEWWGTQRAGSTLHWGPDSGQNRYYLTGAHKINATTDYARGFHKYTMDWSEDGFRFAYDDQWFLNIPDPLIPNNPSWSGFFNYGAPYGQGTNNPWAGRSNMAPFDKEFHFLLNVAVGGTNGFIPDDWKASNRGGRNPKPWNNNMNYYQAFHRFWEGKGQWLWTWEKEGEDAAMQVDYVRVYSKN